MNITKLSSIRRIFSIPAFAIATALLTAFAVSPSAMAQGQGKGAEGKGNSLRAQAELVELEPGDVIIETSNPDAANFEEEFDYYVINHGIAYEMAIYREPARLGGKNRELGGYNGGRFWAGVTGPDENGIQHEINHKGQVSLYLLEEETGQIYLLQLQFNGQGELLDVNGIAPQ